MNSQQEAFRRFAQQLQRASQGAGGFPGGSTPRGLFAGGGLVIALIAGGLALNASLFNGIDILPSLSSILNTGLNGLNAVDGGHRAIKYTRYAYWGLAPRHSL